MEHIPLGCVCLTQRTTRFSLPNSVQCPSIARSSSGFVFLSAYCHHRDKRGLVSRLLSRLFILELCVKSVYDASVFPHHVRLLRVHLWFRHRLNVHIRLRHGYFEHTRTVPIDVLRRDIRA